MCKISSRSIKFFLNIYTNIFFMLSIMKYSQCDIQELIGTGQDAIQTEVRHQGRVRVDSRMSDHC